MKYCILTPAYGRDYQSLSAAQDDLLADMDFIFNDLSSRWDGSPINLTQLREAGYTRVVIRYSGLRRAGVLELSDLEPT